MTTVQLLLVLAITGFVNPAANATPPAKLTERHQNLVPVPVEALTDDDAQLRANAAHALRGLGSEAVPGLVKVLNGKDKDLLLVALGSNAEGALAAMLKILRDKGEVLRRAAANSVVTPPDDLPVIRTWHTAFMVPVHLDPKDLRQIDHLLLWISEDEGKTWRIRGRADREHIQPNFPLSYLVQVVEGEGVCHNANFRVHVAGDGIYWFSLQLVNKDGSKIPSSVRREPPQLKVRVNTKWKSRGQSAE